MNDKAPLDVYKQAEKAISQQKKVLEDQNYSREQLVEMLAQNLVFLKIQDNAFNEMLVRHQSCRKCMVKNSSLPFSEKEKTLKKIIETNRLEVGKIHGEARKVNASKGGSTKTEKDKDGKQQAKSEVKIWWRKWQSNQSLYKNKAEFSRAMLDKFDGILNSQKKIEDWCREWEKEPC